MTPLPTTGEPRAVSAPGKLLRLTWVWPPEGVVQLSLPAGKLCATRGAAPAARTSATVNFQLRMCIEIPPSPIDGYACRNRRRRPDEPPPWGGDAQGLPHRFRASDRANCLTP